MNVVPVGSRPENPSSVKALMEISLLATLYFRILAVESAPPEGCRLTNDILIVNDVYVILS